MRKVLKMTWPNMALKKTWDLRPKIGLQLGRTVARERREEEKREEEEEEEKKKRRRREAMIKKVWNYMGF